jgi:hypothetical protein
MPLDQLSSIELELQSQCIDVVDSRTVDRRTAGIWADGVSYWLLLMSWRCLFTDQRSSASHQRSLACYHAGAAGSVTLI